MGPAATCCKAITCQALERKQLLLRFCTCGVWFAASADKIVAQPGTITGSIGVAFGKLDASQALRDQGINVDTIAVGKNATVQSLFHDFTKEQRRQVNTLMDR